MFPNLRSFLDALRKERSVIEINAAVDPNLELAEIHRRVVAGEGPALLFRSVKGSAFPVVTNLFGSPSRVSLAFGTRPEELIESAVQLATKQFPPSLGELWEKRSVLSGLMGVGVKRMSSGPALECSMDPPDLEKLPVTTSWPLDGGAFFTLPLVYTEHPESRVPNLGIYRMQRYGARSTGMHMQIAKGGGFHLAAAHALGKNLPMNVFLGGPPAALLGAVAPLPENVPEVLIASLALGKKLPMLERSDVPLPILAEAEFALIGEVSPIERQKEGPFGDHYGYYSLTHDFPVFRVKQLFHRKDAIYPATVVGKPRQEDYYLGNYLQELLSPLFPVVMPSVRALWSYGETGYHSLAAAVVRERYKREAMVSAFRILGEGQLSLTKFLLLIDRPLDLKDFPKVLEYILARANFQSDLYIFSHLSMDTLDYTGPNLNEGSKGVLIGMGEPRRELPREFNAPLPRPLTSAMVFCGGCLVVSGPKFEEEPSLASEIAALDAFSNWPLVVLSDNAEFATSSSANFLWSTFTRFEPAADIFSRQIKTIRFHPGLEPPIVIDARMKPGYPPEVECDDETRKLVDRRWREYFG